MSSIKTVTRKTHAKTAAKYGCCAMPLGLTIGALILKHHHNGALKGVDWKTYLTYLSVSAAATFVTVAVITFALQPLCHPRGTYEFDQNGDVSSFIPTENCL